MNVTNTSFVNGTDVGTNETDFPIEGLKVLSGALITAAFCVLVVNIICTLAGVGGGAPVGCVLRVGLKLSFPDAVELAQFGIFPCAFVSSMSNIFWNRDIACEIDQGLCLLTLPMLLNGAYVGALLLIVVPSYVLGFLKGAVLLLVTVVSTEKALRTHKNGRKVAAATHVYPSAVFTSTDACADSSDDLAVTRSMQTSRKSDTSPEFTNTTICSVSNSDSQVHLERSSNDSVSSPKMCQGTRALQLHGFSQGFTPSSRRMDPQIPSVDSQSVFTHTNSFRASHVSLIAPIACSVLGLDGELFITSSTRAAPVLPEQNTYHAGISAPVLRPKFALTGTSSPVQEQDEKVVATPVVVLEPLPEVREQTAAVSKTTSRGLWWASSLIVAIHMGITIRNAYAGDALRWGLLGVETVVMLGFAVGLVLWSRCETASDWSAKGWLLFSGSPMSKLPFIRMSRFQSLFFLSGVGTTAVSTGTGSAVSLVYSALDISQKVALPSATFIVCVASGVGCAHSIMTRSLSWKSCLLFVGVSLVSGVISEVCKRWLYLLGDRTSWIVYVQAIINWTTLVLYCSLELSDYMQSAVAAYNN